MATTLDFIRDAGAIEIVGAGGTFILIYLFGIAILRLFFHPLSKFPGPAIAAITRWYEFYHDVIRDGTFVKYYPVLHKKLGPIVRVGPNHLHVNDADFYRDFAPVVGGIVEHAADITRQRFAKGQPVDVQKLYRCITVDVISTSLFGHTQDLTTQDQNDIFPEFLTSVDLFTDKMWLTKHFSFLNKIALHLPESMAEKVAPGYAHFRSQCAQWIQNIKNRREKGIYHTEDERATVFDLLLEPNPEKGYRVPTMEELVDESFLLLVAGSDTTAYSIACATYYLLTHSDCQRKLKEELKEVPKDENGEIDWKNIAELPYLTAVIKESLRVSSGIPGILPRIVPPGGAQVQGKFIPEGTIVSISTRAIHDNPDIFPVPERFNPDRWLGDKGKELERWNVSFSKGPRACIGLNLAYLEIYLTIATFFSRFDMELYETDSSSMEWLDHGVASNRSYVKVKARATPGGATEMA